MSFVTLILSTFLVALPAIGYYVYWAIWSTRQRLTPGQKDIILRHTKHAYIVIAAVIVYIPGMLVFFLYQNILHQFPSIFRATLVIFAILTLVFEVVNLFSYKYYEKKRIIEA